MTEPENHTRLAWHKGRHAWGKHDGYPMHAHSINGALTIDPHDTHPHFQGEPFGVRTFPNTGHELPTLEEASREDVLLAVSVLGPLSIYGGFLRAALGGIYAERAQAIAESEEKELRHGEGRPR